ncbi:hypothetical protein NKJ86_13830 [Mesorhizobium sp. M0025]|uniref:hypothetical protein n=1 Tax=Mesorhizobium sp. M0025 TaxID=2956846 RepID=UPI00333733F0
MKFDAALVAMRAELLYVLAESLGAGGMETLSFASRTEFVRRARQMAKYLKYDRVPVGKQTWTYGDGSSVETEWGQRGGTVASNFGYMASIANGDLKSNRDQTLIDDIDLLHGVTITIDWSE